MPTVKETPVTNHVLETFESQDLCSICGQPWQKHYKPNLLKYKSGPYGSFGLSADHTPHVPSVHGSRS